MATESSPGSVVAFSQCKSCESKSPYKTARDAAAYVQLSYDHFRELQRLGQTPALRRGRTCLYTTDALDRWVRGELNGRSRRPQSSRTEQNGDYRISCGHRATASAAAGEPPAPSEPTSDNQITRVARFSPDDGSGQNKKPRQGASPDEAQDMRQEGM